MTPVKSIRFLLLPLMLPLIFVIGLAGVARAQNGNALDNPGFEEEFGTRDGDSLIEVAEDWTPWHRKPEGDNAPTWELLQPEFISARESDEFSFVLEGEKAQSLRSFYATFDAGLYQQVGDVETDSWLRFSAFAWVWSSVTDDQEQSERDGDVFVQVGIDPGGGTNPASEDVVWSEVSYEIYDSWREYVVVTQSTDEDVTVFLRALVNDPVRNTQVWFDQTRLVLDAFDEDVISAMAVAIGPTPFPTSVPVYHVVGESETLDSIALRYATSVMAILEANSLSNASLVHPGNQLSIPSGVAPVATPLPELDASAAWYVVRAGDTFSGIADLYGIEVNELAQLNVGVNVNFLVVGQALVVPAVPSPPASSQKYTVRRGDTLNDIALRFSVAIEDLARANNITVTSILDVGQVLTIP
ncbi:MAG: LysM peptidoglycan-binding domain-containing protein [Anaerolineaceae bacterium]|nr:LysM peptidoglycan-binding domain-containing protein [Anaerolineaceae bacterium]